MLSHEVGNKYPPEDLLTPTRKSISLPFKSVFDKPLGVYAHHSLLSYLNL